MTYVYFERHWCKTIFYIKEIKDTNTTIWFEMQKNNNANKTLITMGHKKFVYLNTFYYVSGNL